MSGEDEDFEYELDDNVDLENIEWEVENSEEQGLLDDSVEDQQNNGETIEFEYEDDPLEVSGKRKVVLEHSPPSKKQRTVKILTTDDAHDIALQRCQDDLTLRLSWLKDVMEWSSSEILASIMQSLLPLDLVDSIGSTSPITHLESIARWVKSSFKLIQNTDITFEEGRDGSCVEDLLEHVIPNRAGSLSHITQLWIALLRSFGYRCRLAACIDTLSLSPYDHPDLYILTVTNPTSSSSSTNIHKMKKDTCTKRNLDSKKMKDDRLLLWAEVWLKSEGCSSSGASGKESTAHRWVPVHPILSIFNCPESIESIIRKGKIVKCVISVEASAVEKEYKTLTFMDVTSRYNFKHQQPTRIVAQMEGVCRKWLQLQLEKMSTLGKENAPTTPKVQKREDGILCIDLVDDSDEDLNQQQRRQAEKDELIKIEKENKKHNLPKTFIEFKDHPYYLLERHLLTDEVIHPDKKKSIVGIFKGEPIYLQSFREKLKTKIQWRKELRMVLPDAEPVKITKRQVLKKSAGSSPEKGTLVSTDWKLFGVWQTVQYEVPKIIDGVIPVNEHGNIEVWGGNARYVPEGATYVDHPFAIKAAKSLGINYVQALVGFESKGPVTIPKIGGIVVLDPYVQLLHDALFEMTAWKNEMQYNKKEEEIMRKWARFARRLLTRDRLRVDYGY